jgi:hypothetical protein
MSDIEQHLKKGLINGYNQNQILHASYVNNDTSITEYLLTVTVAQQLIEWNEENHYLYSLYLEYSTEKFFKNAFLPYMEVGNNIWDMGIIHPEVIKSIKENEDIRTGRIDLAVCKAHVGYGDFKDSLMGIELKGINPNLNKVIEDVQRLVLSIEMKDVTFGNSIQTGYCLFVKKLGGDKRLSSKEALVRAMSKSIENLDKVIKAKVKTSTANIEVLKEIIEIKTKEDFDKMGNKEEITSNEVAEETKIVYSVLIKITRQ